MESKTMKYGGNPGDHQEILVTFRSLDSSNIGFFTDDDDDHNFDEEEEETSYIEIAFDEPHALSIPLPHQIYNPKRDQGRGGEKAKEKQKEKSTTGDHPDNQELEFQASLYPSVSEYPGFPSSSSPTLSFSTNTNNTTTASTSSNCSPAGAAAYWYAINSRESSPAGHSKLSPIPRVKTTSNLKTKMQFPVFHHLLNALLSAFKPSSSLKIPKESGRPDDYEDDDNKKTALNTTGSWELERSTKTSLTTAVNHGGATAKLLIKFKSVTIQSVVTQFLKSQQVVVSPGGKNTSQQNKSGPNKLRSIKKYQRRLMKPFDRWTSGKPRNWQEDQSNFNTSSISSMDKYSLDAIRGMLESLKVMKIRHKKVKQMSRSCLNSIKSSPLQGGEVLVPIEARKFYTRDNSVQAAIAHCKSSFGQVQH